MYKITYLDETDSYILETIIVDADNQIDAEKLANEHRKKYPLLGQTWKSPIKFERLNHV